MTLTIRRTLAASGLLLGIGAAVFRSPYPARSAATIDVAGLAADIVQERDHVSAIELAEWIRDRKPMLRVLDVRTPEEFREYHIPTAERISLEAIAAQRFSPDETLVLYSGGGAHAAQAWVLLRALGHRRAFFLSGGLDEWIADVMSPSLPAKATPADKARFQRALDVCQYFGGEPAVPGDAAARGERRKVPRWRRGC